MSKVGFGGAPIFVFVQEHALKDRFVEGCAGLGEGSNFLGQESKDPGPDCLCAGHVPIYGWGVVTHV